VKPPERVRSTRFFRFAGLAAARDEGLCGPAPTRRVSAMPALRRRPGPGTMPHGTRSYWDRRTSWAFGHSLRFHNFVMNQPVMNQPAMNELVMSELVVNYPVTNYPVTNSVE
jgi:hypothetical protein